MSAWHSYQDRCAELIPVQPGWQFIEARQRGELVARYTPDDVEGLTVADVTWTYPIACFARIETRMTAGLDNGNEVPRGEWHTGAKSRFAIRPVVREYRDMPYSGADLAIREVLWDEFLLAPGEELPPRVAAEFLENARRLIAPPGGKIEELGIGGQVESALIGARVYTIRQAREIAKTGKRPKGLGRKGLAILRAALVDPDRRAP